MTDATSIIPTQVLSGVLSDPTAVLFGLEKEFSVLTVDRCGPCAVKVIIEQIARDGRCPDCGVLSSVVKDRPLIRVKDLPASGQAVELWWRTRAFDAACRCAHGGRSRRPRRRCGRVAASPNGKAADLVHSEAVRELPGGPNDLMAWDAPVKKTLGPLAAGSCRRPRPEPSSLISISD